MKISPAADPSFSVGAHVRERPWSAQEIEAHRLMGLPPLPMWKGIVVETAATRYGQPGPWLLVKRSGLGAPQWFREDDLRRGLHS